MEVIPGLLFAANLCETLTKYGIMKLDQVGVSLNIAQIYFLASTESYMVIVGPNAQKWKSNNFYDL